MDCIVHGVTKSRTRLSDFHFTSNAADVGLIPGCKTKIPHASGQLKPAYCDWRSLRVATEISIVHLRHKSPNAQAPPQGPVKSESLRARPR